MTFQRVCARQLTSQGGSELISLRAFVKTDLHPENLRNYLTERHAATITPVFENTNSDTDTVITKVTVRIAELEFTITLNQFLTDAARKRASSKIYLGSTKITESSSLAELLFTCYIPYPSYEFLDVITDVIANFGGGFITSDVHSEYINTYSTIDSQVEAHSSVFVS